MFEYFESPQYVRLRDKKVAVCYYALLVLVFVLYSIFLWSINEHMVVDTVQGGHIFVKLESPKPNEKLSTNGLSYCQTTTCEMQDAMQLVESRGGDVFVRTMHNSVLQNRSCETCPGPIWEDAGTLNNTAFTVMPESHFLVIEHSLGRSQLFDTKFAGSSRGFQGQLLDMNGQPIKKFDSKEDDRLLLQDLMRAAGVEALDKNSDYKNIDNTSSTFRQAGLALELDIHYSNLPNCTYTASSWCPPGNSLQIWRRWTTTPQTYTYRVKQVPATRVIRIRTEPEGAHQRWLRESSGFHITVQLTGMVGEWSILSLVRMLPLSTVLGMVTQIMYWFILLCPSLKRQREQMIKDAADEGAGTSTLSQQARCMRLQQESNSSDAGLDSATLRRRRR